MASSANSQEKTNAVGPEDVAFMVTPEPVSTTDNANTIDEIVVASNRPDSSEDAAYPSGLKLSLIITSLLLSMFLVSLDRMIITTAIPQITDDFNSVDDIGWYGSAFLMTQCAFQLLYGKIYSFYSIKYTFLTAIVFFEVGSAVCGVAPSSAVFIVGRAIAGLGAAGGVSGVMVITARVVPLHKRGLYQGMFGSIYGISSALGPILGGVFTSKVTWRWCFYINLPFGGLAIAGILLALAIPEDAPISSLTMAKLTQLDFLGTGLIVPGLVCMILALQWGGSTYPAIEGVTAVGSGIRTLPLVMSMVVATIASGVIVHRIGYYTPPLIIGVCLTCVGGGLLTTLQVNTSSAKLAGYQIVYGSGLGLALQAPILAAQTVLSKADIPIGVSFPVFAQLFSGAIFVSVGQNVFDSQLIRRLSSLPDFSPEMILNSGATSLTTLPALIKPQVLVAYNESLRKVFQVGLVLACINILGAVTMEWRSMKVKKPTKGEEVGPMSERNESSAAAKKARE